MLPKNKACTSCATLALCVSKSSVHFFPSFVQHLHWYFFFCARGQNKSHQLVAKNASQGANPSYRWSASTSEHEGTSPSAPCATLSSSNEVAMAFAAAQLKNPAQRNRHACSARFWRSGVSPTGPKRNWFRQTSALQLPQPGQPDGPDSDVPFVCELPQEPPRPCWVHRHEGCHHSASRTPMWCRQPTDTHPKRRRPSTTTSKRRLSVVNTGWWPNESIGRPHQQRCKEGGGGIRKRR